MYIIGELDYKHGSWHVQRHRHGNQSSVPHKDRVWGRGSELTIPVSPRGKG